MVGKLPQVTVVHGECIAEGPPFTLDRQRSASWERGSASECQPVINQMTTTAPQHMLSSILVHTHTYTHTKPPTNKRKIKLNKNQDRRDRSIGKGACCQQPEVNPLNPHWGGREPIPKGCPLNSVCLAMLTRVQNTPMSVPQSLRKQIE